MAFKPRYPTERDKEQKYLRENRGRDCVDFQKSLWHYACKQSDKCRWRVEYQMVGTLGCSGVKVPV